MFHLPAGKQNFIFAKGQSGSTLPAYLRLHYTSGVHCTLGIHVERVPSAYIFISIRALVECVYSTKERGATAVRDNLMTTIKICDTRVLYSNYVGTRVETPVRWGHPPRVVSSHLV